MHAIKSIRVGEKTNVPLEPTDINFSFYSYGYGTDEDGEIDYNKSYRLITHEWGYCDSYDIDVKELTDEKDIELAKVHILCARLCNIIKKLQDTEEYQYQEMLLDTLDNWVEDGELLLQMYDQSID